MQALADVDIAEPCDEPLVQKRCLEGCFSSAEQAGQAGSVEFIAERFEPQIAEKRMGAEIGSGDQIHEAEAAGIVVGDHRPVREVKHHMVMGGGC